MLRKYEGNDNYGKPKSEYLSKIAGMSREELLEETEQKIWLSAFAANNPRSDYHWQCDACYDEWVKRNDVGGYEKAWKRAANQ
ncbi:hypothetical protein EDM57_04900 [Brevibacillus gelatini]|uniref:Uncharacterized protein n=1 Tax=Brevibacillus gelatini TaxID=1655277 RepID=A0A3M8B838_9BACL|nr:hypothetical protein [Brevibacillus gelatini]RNB59483.1 hypothetical protein EDM57_04900 [Brevibacillus gelatini]